MSETDLKVGEFKINGLHHNILIHLKEQGLSSAELYDKLPKHISRFYSVSELVTDVASVMVVDGLLVYDAGLWSVAQAGYSMLNFLNSQMQSTAVPTVAAKKSYIVPSGSYNGAELKDTCLRKGAYDFLALPSLYGGKSVEHRTAKAFLGEQYAKTTA